ncbi:MAG: hypothetical protein ACRDY0_11500 [Acidimicrobiales bacterium]
MHGPEILARFLSVPNPKPDKYGNFWQYNSRSDRHSKVACWGVAFDLLTTSRQLRRHVTDGQVVLGVNHAMIDFATNRQKDLDLVIARPGGPIDPAAETFADQGRRYGVILSPDEEGELEALPQLRSAPVGAVLIALEAKACMTAHIKSLPRLYDELNSSHLCVHGASRQALAIGFVQVNNSDRFVSSVTNNRPVTGAGPLWSEHRQPEDTLRVLAKVAEMPRRSSSSEVGFVRARNSGPRCSQRRKPRHRSQRIPGPDTR